MSASSTVHSFQMFSIGQPLTDEELWQVWCGSSKFLGWGARDASASGSQHLVCSKPSALGSAVLDCPQRLQGDSSFCAACPTTHTKEGGPLLCFKKYQWVVTSSLLMCPCYVPALPPAMYFQVHAFTSQSLLVTVLVSTLTQHCGTPIYSSSSFL